MTDGTGVEPDPAGLEPAAEDLAWLGQVLDLVRERKGLDFGGYRAATLLRRARNRLIAANVRSLPEYLERLRDDPAEADALVERLTVKVSRFYRDAATFDALRAALAARLAGGPGRPLEAWSAGCGQGEEPYSLAILLAELGQAPSGAPDVLATDIDPAALAFAGRGCYPASALAELPPALRTTCFDEIPAPKGSLHRVKPALRGRVAFRLHDLAAGGPPPDGRGFDLVCCRNVLIYLQPPLQETVERQLADAVRPGGLLCLGEAEWLLPSVASLFTVVDRKARLFCLRGE